MIYSDFYGNTSFEPFSKSDIFIKMLVEFIIISKYTLDSGVQCNVRLTIVKAFVDFSFLRPKTFIENRRWMASFPRISINESFPDHSTGPSASSLSRWAVCCKIWVTSVITEHYFCICELVHRPWVPFPLKKIWNSLSASV